MKFKKTALVCVVTCLMIGSLSAAPIENVNLSQNTGANTTSATPVATTTAPNIPTNLNWELVQKTERLENEVRSLRGSLEEQQNTIDQLKKDAENRYNDLDQRLQLLQQKVDPESNASEDGDDTASEPSSTNSTSPSATSDKTATTTAAVPVTPVKAPSTNTASSNTNIDKTTPTPKPQSEKQAYTTALDAYKQGGAKSAISPMQNFIKTYPNSIYIGNAHFWLAEFNLAIEPPNYTDAKKNYEIVAKQYPQSAKAARSLYQLYSIAKNIDKNTVSANLYRQQLLTKYPKSEEAGFVKKG
ncbi:YbgF trimerization domain-containing protein [Acinetobacter sp. MD2]|uniref:YbgF trimerization domain-containing protein n=1 Tax=Acinetobacter sp. MD2 TaxID=2600066 RepID=UPI002D1E5FE1|nr:YbgF trimerization domain-containing protein [Acinetobacter sp. MD2]MEB3766509.1 hypothetical protein [Acinetobacter sp. MD2]